MDTMNMHGFTPGFYVDVSAFVSLKTQMLACLAVGEAFEHPSACGTASEQRWIDLFNRYLPQRYRAATVMKAKQTVQVRSYRWRQSSIRMQKHLSLLNQRR